MEEDLLCVHVPLGILIAFPIDAAVKASACETLAIWKRALLTDRPIVPLLLLTLIICFAVISLGEFVASDMTELCNHLKGKEKNWIFADIERSRKKLVLFHACSLWSAWIIVSLPRHYIMYQFDHDELVCATCFARDRRVVTIIHLTCLRTAKLSPRKWLDEAERTLIRSTCPRRKRENWKFVFQVDLVKTAKTNEQQLSAPQPRQRSSWLKSLITEK